MSLPKHQTKSELALHVLRDRLRSGELQPGQRLLLGELTSELQMSPTPIREALRVLQADGLVTYRPHRGIVVANRSHEEIEDVYRVRIAVEPLAVELAVPLLTDEQLEELVRLHRKLEAALNAQRFRSFSAINGAWHWEIYETCRPQYLKDLIRRLWEIVSWRTMWVLPGWPEESFGEHSGIMEAILARDAGLAADRMRRHVERSREYYVASLAMSGGNGEGERMGLPPS